MIVKVSKVFAKFMNQTAAEMGLNFHASVVEMSEPVYNYQVGNITGKWSDYNDKTDKFKAIMVEYPAACYACPLFFSTSRLNTLFNRYAVETYEDLKNMIREVCEI